MDSNNDSIQTINIYMDDSGKLTTKEHYTVFGGLVFVESPEKIKFANKYKKIIKGIKCEYCKGNECNKNCPEIKSMIIEASHRRRLLNLCKNYKTFALIINNDDVYDSIKTRKESRGRYIDYAQKLMVKDIVLKLIRGNIIEPNKKVKINLNIDQQTTKSNGYYNLKEGIYEELVHGIRNFDYGIFYPPILKELELNVKYIDSKKNYLIQAADLIAGSVRRIVVDERYHFSKRIAKINGFLWIYRKLPKKKENH